MNSPSQKGHKEMPATYKFQIAFVTASQKLRVKNRGTNNKNTVFQALNGAGVFAYMETYTLRPTPSFVPMNAHQRGSIQYLSMETVIHMFDKRQAVNFVQYSTRKKSRNLYLLLIFSGPRLFFLQYWVIDFF